MQFISGLTALFVVISSLHALGGERPYDTELRLKQLEEGKPSEADLDYVTTSLGSEWKTLRGSAGKVLSKWLGGPYQNFVSERLQKTWPDDLGLFRSITNPNLKKQIRSELDELLRPYGFLRLKGIELEDFHDLSQQLYDAVYRSEMFKNSLSTARTLRDRIRPHAATVEPYLAAAHSASKHFQATILRIAGNSNDLKYVKHPAYLKSIEELNKTLSDLNAAKRHLFELAGCKDLKKVDNTFLSFAFDEKQYVGSFGGHKLLLTRNILDGDGRTVFPINTAEAEIAPHPFRLKIFLEGTLDEGTEFTSSFTLPSGMSSSNLNQIVAEWARESSQDQQSKVSVKLLSELVNGHSLRLEFD